MGTYGSTNDATQSLGGFKTTSGSVLPTLCDDGLQTWKFFTNLYKVSKVPAHVSA